MPENMSPALVDPIPFLGGGWRGMMLPAGRPERRSHVHTSEETARIHGNMVIFVRKAGNMFTINIPVFPDVSRAKFQMILLGDFSHP